MGIMKALKEKWIDGECRHICYVCDVAFGCHFHADICKKRDKMLNEIYEFGKSNAKDKYNSKLYDKGWHDCYEFYKRQIKEPIEIDKMASSYADEEVIEW